MDLPNMDHQLENILKICCCRALDNLRAWDTSRPSRATSDDSLDTVSQASSQSTEIWWRISKQTRKFSSNGRSRGPYLCWLLVGLCETSIVPNWPSPPFCGCIYVGKPVSFKFKMYRKIATHCFFCRDTWFLQHSNYKGLQRISWISWIKQAL